MGWADRAAVVTGASRGIGRAVAEALAAEGARIALLARDAAALEEVAAVCTAAGAASAVPLPVDVTDAAGVSTAVAQALDAFDGRLDLLANVAGSSLRHARVEELDDGDWQAAFELNLLAAAKAGLAALTRATALEWARDGIRANTVEPGYVDTDFNARLRAAGLEERLLARVPTRRPISAVSVARVVLFAGDPANRDLTGAVLRVDGGMTARL
ncbi:MAG TPA: SDR family oxidoreductase [Egibacteraceae bacterium]